MEIQITQDIRKFKTKDIGNFSFKEAGFLALGAGAAFLTYKLTNSFDLCIVPIFIVVVVAFFKPFGLTFIQFTRTVLKESLSPQTYINETDFTYEPDEFDELYEEDIAIPENWNTVIQTESVNSIEKIGKVDINELAT